MWEYHYTDELYHHGIPGMKWGIRRYQNKDGSLTPRGVKRVKKLESQYNQLTNKKLNNNKVKVKVTKKRTYHDLTDDELTTKNKRMTNEINYVNNINKIREFDKPKISRGRKIVNKIFNDVVIPGATEAAKESYKKYMESAFDSLLGNKSNNKKK